LNKLPVPVCRFCGVVLYAAKRKDSCVCRSCQWERSKAKCRGKYVRKVVGGVK